VTTPRTSTRHGGAHKGRLLALLAGAALLTLWTGAAAEPLPAAADPAASGWYVASDFGIHIRQDGPTRSEFPELGAIPVELRFHTNKQVTGLARVGYRVLPRIRFELEAGWRPTRMKSVVDQFTLTRPPGSITGVCGDAPADAPPLCGRPGGHVDAWTVMSNGYLDLWPRNRLHPFFGVGVGIAHVSLQADGRFVGPTTPGRLSINNADTKIAYQAIGGAALRLSDRWSADLSYRFLYSGHHEWNTTVSGDIPLGRITGRFEDHAFTLGLRYAM
jgi:opacity protein-like surface antigen